MRALRASLRPFQSNLAARTSQNDGIRSFHTSLIVEPPPSRESSGRPIRRKPGMLTADHRCDPILGTAQRPSATPRRPHEGRYPAPRGPHTTAPPRRGGGAIRREPRRRPSVHPCHLGAGRARRRSVHQWTACAWVPVGLAVVLCRFDRRRHSFRRLQFYSCAEGTARVSENRPARTSSATRVPASAARTMAVQDCRIHSETPSRSPRW